MDFFPSVGGVESIGQPAIPSSTRDTRESVDGVSTTSQSRSMQTGRCDMYTVMWGSPSHTFFLMLSKISMSTVGPLSFEMMKGFSESNSRLHIGVELTIEHNNSKPRSSAFNRVGHTWSSRTSVPIGCLYASRRGKRLTVLQLWSAKRRNTCHYLIGELSIEVGKG